MVLGMIKISQMATNNNIYIYYEVCESCQSTLVSYNVLQKTNRNGQIHILGHESA